MGRMWLLWPGDGVAFSASAERDFVSGLSVVSLSLPEPLPSRRTAVSEQDGYGFDRDDVTVLMSLLRCGADLEGAVAAAPGLVSRSGRLLAAYALLQARHQVCVKAWGAVASGARSSMLRAAPRSSRLMPSPTRLIRAAPVDGLADVRSEVVGRVAAVSAEAARVHERACSLPSFDERADAGAMLFHPYEGGLFRSPWFLPDRVSALSPEGVASLLPVDLPQGRV